MRILVTRPEEDAAELAKALEAAGREPVLCSLLNVVFTATAPLDIDGVAALIATSRNGLRGLSHAVEKSPSPAEAWLALTRLPIFCVGGATARLARELGFALIYSGAGGARDLLPLIDAHVAPSDGVLLHLGGDRLAFDLPAALARRGYRTRLETLYRAEPATELPPSVVAALRRREIGGVMLMSPRTARIFVELLELHGLVGTCSPMVCYCLSPAVAQAIGLTGGMEVRVAQKPNLQDILALVGPETAH